MWEDTQGSGGILSTHPLNAFCGVLSLLHLPGEEQRSSRARVVLGLCCSWSSSWRQVLWAPPGTTCESTWTLHGSCRLKTCEHLSVTEEKSHSHRGVGQAAAHTPRPWPGPRHCQHHCRLLMHGETRGKCALMLYHCRDTQPSSTGQAHSFLRWPSCGVHAGGVMAGSQATQQTQCKSQVQHKAGS